MDGYRDLYRVPVLADYRVPVSADYYSRYPLGYGVEGRSSYLLPAAEPAYSSYSRAALDPYAGYTPSIAYQPELVPLPQYSTPTVFYSPRRRPKPQRRPAKQNLGKGRPAPAESLAPRKKPFKRTQKDSPVDTKGSKRQQGSDRKLPSQEQKKAGNVHKSSSETLAKETQELHKLFRTGVDSSGGKKNSVLVAVKQAAGTPVKKNYENKALTQKRKAEDDKKVEAPSAVKKRKGKKRARKERQKQDKDGKLVEAPKVTKVEKADPPALTEEEKKQMEASLELQHSACKAIADFLGVPEKSVEPEAEKSEPARAEVTENNAATLAEAQDKTEEAPKLPIGPTPEEEKELEEKAFAFFSELLEENNNLRKLYLEKKDAGTFECLVCHSVDPETSKKFKDLTSLVMHTSMRKQKRPEHQGYGKAICDILGWEPLRGAKSHPVKQVKDDNKSAKQVEVESTTQVEVDKVSMEESKEDGTSDE